MRNTLRYPFLIAALAGLVPARAEFKLNALFTDNAVLQRDAVVPVWGTAAPGEKVTVEFSDQKKSCTADAAGAWKVTLDPMPACNENRPLMVSGDKTAAPLAIKDVLVGDVWLCSGQSNMARPLGPYPKQQPLVNWEAEAASADYPRIRHLLVKNGAADTPAGELTAAWQVCSPQTAPNFTAVGYYFGRDLHKHLSVPIGLINSSVGGTPAEAWTSREVLEARFPDILAEHEKSIVNHADESARYQREALALLGQWTKRAEAARLNGQPEPQKPAPPPDPRISVKRPASLFNGKIAPLIPCAIKGVVWYQGESHFSRPGPYRALFPAMIDDWRKRWQRPDLPFLFVQVAPHKVLPPELREAQLIAWQNTPFTAMVVSTDVGDAQDIHPPRKEPVGERLALAARALAYGEKIVYSGPVFSGLTLDGDTAVLQFAHAGGGLVAQDGPLRGFTVSGDAKNFVSAEAEISGDSVKVRAAGVAAPVAVRYGWANVPDVNLFNAEGLPATPFRTDVD